MIRLAAKGINEAGEALIKRWESLELTAYQDPGGVWTIGWGHTGDVHEGEVITESDATSLLFSDLYRFETTVTTAILGIPTNDNQYAAMVSLAYNIGSYEFLTSSVLRFHKVAQYFQAANSFLL